MKIKALVSFCGAVTMAKGEVREVADSSVTSDLIGAGYAQAVGAADPDNPEVKNEDKRSKPKAR